MKKIYTLSSAFTLNATGEKVDAVASPATHAELVASRADFQFDFRSLLKEYTVYKLQVGPNRTIEGLVAFRPTRGILECANMEICHGNKHGSPIYNGVGKSMVALCCIMSQDVGLDGYIFLKQKID